MTSTKGHARIGRTSVQAGSVGKVVTKGLQIKGNVLFDGRNIWDGNRVREQGFTYYGIGVR